jgi:hypothetical protein
VPDGFGFVGYLNAGESFDDVFVVEAGHWTFGGFYYDLAFLHRFDRVQFYLHLLHLHPTINLRAIIDISSAFNPIISMINYNWVERIIIS